jgi:hypothetical protein
VPFCMSVVATKCIAQVACKMNSQSVDMHMRPNGNEDLKMFLKKCDPKL